ncbi:MAG: circularly permuted type 2 ATP-grasp protein [Gemmatimonadaceae bacterium]|jgi:uncharacterized circularly permuted ATP-grasp superfamily protein|nr:circularly permuted type 2 ATP-grasp protein [Gemmatimonadaceae bacterium]
MSSLFANYQPATGTYDELFDAASAPRANVRAVLDALGASAPADFARSQALAEMAMLTQGITFSVYADSRGTEKVFPFDLVPRIVAAADWAHLERGLAQRVAAIGHFLDDVYSAQRCFQDGVIPAELVLGAKQYLPMLRGIAPPGGVRVHIAGIDLIRDSDGTFRVLEDNVRTPSGVSYVVENRLATKRIFPRLFERAAIHRVDHYPAQLAETLRAAAPQGGDAATVVVLTPGPFNSAYFEHSFLARQMGVELVEASDLFVERDRVFLRTTLGPRPVDVIYRRTDEAFLDPEVFRPDSMLGVPGLMRAWRAGHVTLANAPGNGVADDKAVYPFIPDLIRYYLGEDALLAQVPTYVCLREADRAYVVDHLHELVVKAVDESGGYGMLMGPQATREERDEFRHRILADPRKYIAQPRVELSTCPTWCAETQRMEPRRVDLRPYILTTRAGSWVLPGGLTRVALVPGSYVVNSSQGGGSKDTWVQKERA